MWCKVGKEEIAFGRKRANTESTKLPGKSLDPSTERCDSLANLVLVLQGRKGCGLAGSGQGIGVVVSVEIIGQVPGQESIADAKACQTFCF